MCKLCVTIAIFQFERSYVCTTKIRSNFKTFHNGNFYVGRKKCSLAKHRPYFVLSLKYIHSHGSKCLHCPVMNSCHTVVCIIIVIFCNKVIFSEHKNNSTALALCTVGLAIKTFFFYLNPYEESIPIWQTRIKIIFYVTAYGL